MRSRTLFLVLSGLLLAQAVAPLQAYGARGPRWVLLGELTVTDRVDHDTLRVTAARGTFRAIQLKVEDQGVEVRDLKIRFANGDVQDVELRRVIPAGGKSRVIDVEGRDRVIQAIDFVYDAQSLRGRKARVRVFGRH